MDINAMFAVYGPNEGTVLVQSPIVILVAVLAVVLLLGLLIGLLVGRISGSKNVTSPPAAIPAVQSADADEEELVAVIITTILAMESIRTGNQLILRGISYTGSEGSAWSAAGRRNLMK